MANRSSSGQSLPKWVLPVVIAVGILVVGFIGWKAYTGSSSAATGQAVEVRPGMIDYKKEMQKGHPASPLGDALH